MILRWLIMKYESLNGILDSEAKILKLNPLLLYVRVSANGQPVNCLVSKHALNFLYQLQHNSRLALYGHYNNRKQFIISKYMITAPVNAVAI